MLFEKNSYFLQVIILDLIDKIRALGLCDGRNAQLSEPYLMESWKLYWDLWHIMG